MESAIIGTVCVFLSYLVGNQFNGKLGMNVCFPLQIYDGCFRQCSFLFRDFFGCFSVPIFRLYAYISSIRAITNFHIHSNNLRFDYRSLLFVLDYFYYSNWNPLLMIGKRVDALTSHLLILDSLQ